MAKESVFFSMDWLKLEIHFFLLFWLLISFSAYVLKVWTNSTVLGVHLLNYQKKKNTWRIELRGLNPISFFIMNLLIAFHSCTEMKYFKYLLFYCGPPISRSEIFFSRANHYNSTAARWMASKDIYGDTGGWIIIKGSIWFDWLIYLLTNWLIDWLIGLIIISILLYFLSFCFSFNSSECLLTFYSFLIFIIIL